MPQEDKKEETKEKHKIEFSKIIFITVSCITIAVVIFTMVMIFITKDMGPLSYLIPAVFTELATGTGFYYWKAKVENQLKIQQNNPGATIDISNDIDTSKR